MREEVRRVTTRNTMRRQAGLRASAHRVLAAPTSVIPTGYLPGKSSSTACLRETEPRTAAPGAGNDAI